MKWRGVACKFSQSHLWLHVKNKAAANHEVAGFLQTRYVANPRASGSECLHVDGAHNVVESVGFTAAPEPNRGHSTATTFRFPFNRLRLGKLP